MISVCNRCHCHFCLTLFITDTNSSKLSNHGILNSELNNDQDCDRKFELYTIKIMNRIRGNAFQFINFIYNINVKIKNN
jgi:hypothetical protein